MMRRLVVAGLVVAAAAVLAGPASAKGESLQQGSVVICGPTDCAPFDDAGGLRWLNGLMVADSPTPRGAPPVSDYYELRLVEGSAQVAIGWVAPDQGAIRTRRFVGTGTHSEWYPLAGGVPGALEVAARGIEPFPAPGVSRVAIDGRSVDDPGTYLPLLGELPAAAPAGPGGERTEITLRPTALSPWALSSDTTLDYAPAEEVLRVGLSWYRVPQELADLIEGATDLVGLPPAEPAADDGTFPWGIAGGLAGAALLAAAYAGVRRLRGARGAQPV
jgi:hypothetical protein